MPALETKEFKIAPLAEFKAVDGDAGGFEGYPSKFYDLDEVGDIILPGAYKKALPVFLQRGFIAHSHDWETDEACGYPVEGREDGVGLWCRVAFHSTAKAQEVRTIVAERLAAGKTVSLSIGYMLAPGGYEMLWPEDYGKLSEYVPETKLAATLVKAANFGCIRIIREIDELFEFSVVTVPALRSAEVTGIKALASGSADELTFEAHSGVVVDAVRELTERAKARHQMRVKAGRVLSGANIEKLSGIRDGMRECADMLDGLLADAAPKEEPKGADVAALLVREKLRMEKRRALARA